VSSLEFRASTTLRFKTACTYDDTFDRVTAIANTWYDSSGANPVLVSQYGYGHDARGRRTHRQRSGQAFATTPFSGDFYEKYAYNDRDELTGADYYTGTFDTGTAVPANDRIYAYDPIGNRQSARAGESGPLLEYVPNSRNQYHRAGGGGLSQGYHYDEDGNLVELYVAADMNCDGQVGFPDINCFVEAIASCPPNPANYSCDPCPCLNGDLDGDGVVGFRDINYFSSLIPSNGLRRAQTWDAQNRLVAVGPPDGVTPADGAKRLTMKYDHRNRRVWKQVETYTSGTGWQITEQHKFLWDGWLMLLELDAMDEDAVVRQYTWGLDLEGQRDGESREAAGGIGGLLAVHDATISAGVDYLYAYDAGGNVGQVLSVSPATWDASSVLVARYEYDPYGAVTAQAGAYATANPIRWSTKYWDAETALGYWGERWYDAGMGRYVNADPIQEVGGANLYAYALNDPVRFFDALGHCVMYGDGSSTCGDGQATQPASRPAQSQPASCPASQPTTGPATQPTDDDICNTPEAQKLIDQAAEGTGARGVGTVICYNGRKIVCARTPNVGGDPPDDVKGPLKDCVKEHERRHLPDTEDCPKDQKGMSLPPRKDKDDPTKGHEQECYGYCAEAKCLTRMHKSCKTEECKQAALKRLDQIKGQIRDNCRSIIAQPDEGDPVCPKDKSAT
jgi:RHS repeat-associated protein